MQGPFLRKYGVQTTINFHLFEVDGVDFRVDAADGGSDCSIMKNEGAEATCTNDFADEGTGYSLVLTATEMEAARIVVYIIDSATKVWLDTAIVIETYGHASAMHAFDLDTSSVAQTGDSYARLGALGAGLTAITDKTDNIPASPAPSGEYDTQLDANMSTRAPASEYDTEMARITGDVALASGVDLTHIMGTILTEGGAGRLAAAFIKLLDVAAPLLVASEAMRGTNDANTVVPDVAGTAPTAVESREEMDANSTELAKIGTIPALDGAAQTIGAAIAKIADDNAGADFDATSDSLQALRDRGDAAWITGGGGSIADILNIQALIPNDIDLANTVTVRIGLGLTNMLDDLPSTDEITPGTITIDRKAIGGTTWTNMVNAAACSELAGLIYYDEVFDTGTGYAEGDSIRITFKSQKITVAANDYEITGTDGWTFQTSIRQTMRGTDGANTVVPDVAGTAPTAVEIQAEMEEDGASILDTLQDRLTAARAGYLDELGAANIPADVDTLLSRLSAARAGYLDELAAANIPADVDTLLTRIAAAVALASVCTEARLAELDAANLPADVAARATPADVNAQVLDVMNVDTHAEPGQEKPAATASIFTKINNLHKSWRNKKDNDGSYRNIYADGGATVDQKSSVSEVAGTVTVGEVESGP